MTVWMALALFCLIVISLNTGLSALMAYRADRRAVLTDRSSGLY